MRVQETDDMGDAILRRHTQTHVDMIGHQMPFKDIDAYLPAQIQQNRSNLFSHLAIQLLLTILRHKQHMVFAVPLDAG